MGHGHGAAAGDLRLEDRDDRADRAEHVAEAHRDEPRRRPPALCRPLCRPLGVGGLLGIEGLGIHLGEALGDAELRHRLDGLVGRDHHQRARARRDGRVRDVDRAEDVGLDALGPVALEIGHLLERRGVHHVIRPEPGKDRVQAVAVADIGERARHLGLGMGQGRLAQDPVQRRLGTLHHQDGARPEGDRAGADLRPDRAAAARDDDAGAGEEALQPRPVDRDGRAQEQVLDLERRQLGVAHPLAEADDAGERQAEAAGAGDEVVGLGLRRQRARRCHEAPHRLAALGEVAHHPLEIREAAEHRHPAHHLPGLVGAGRQDALGAELAHRARFDGAQQHLDVAAPPEEQRRHRGAARARLPGAGIFEVAEGEAGAAEQEDLQHPVEDDRDLAEEVEAVEVGRDQHVVEHQKRQRQHARGPHDAGEIGQRGEAPLRPVELEPRVDEPGKRHEGRQQERERVQPLGEELAVEAEHEGEDHGQRGRHEIVDHHHRCLVGALLHGLRAGPRYRRGVRLLSTRRPGPQAHS
ncbi:hypothetical protein AEGHOMDF_4438 [Methylobacterium soli]|nr:hypothetical protein AEGHOMDF_4438 [Methylobacterium soli]